MKKITFYLMMLLAVAIFAACSSDDDGNITLNDQTIYAGDSVKLTSSATTDNKFIAYISKSGYLHGYHVGETNVSIKGETAKVTVRGHYNAFKVQTDWGLSPEQVKANQGKTVDRDFMSDGKRFISYQNVGIANTLAYVFENNKLKYAMAFSNPKDMDELVKFLKERYLILPEEVDSYTYVMVDAFDPADSKTWVLISLNTNYKTDYMLQTMFTSTADTKSSTNNEHAIASQIMKALANN